MNIYTKETAGNESVCEDWLIVSLNCIIYTTRKYMCASDSSAYLMSALLEMQLTFALTQLDFLNDKKLLQNLYN